MCCPDEARARVRDAGRTGVGDERDLLAPSYAGDQPRCLTDLVVLPEAHEGLLYLVVREQLGCPPRVFRGDQIDGLQRAQRPEREVFEVANRRGDNKQGPGHCVGCVLGVGDGIYNGGLSGCRHASL